MKWWTLPWITTVGLHVLEPGRLFGRLTFCEANASVLLMARANFRSVLPMTPSASCHNLVTSGQGVQMGGSETLAFLQHNGAVSRVGRGDLARKQLGATASARGGGALLFLCESEPTV